MRVGMGTSEEEGGTGCLEDKVWGLEEESLLERILSRRMTMGL